jgi:2-phosphoglycerate kinase
MIYLIGGEARSGKTIVRKKLLSKYQISGIGTDSIRYMLSHTLKDSGIDHNNTPEINGPLMWPFIDNLIKDLSIYAAEDYVIEGDILLPKYLKTYKESSGIKVCYIGFPTVSISQKMKNILQSRKEGDWTKEYTEKELKKFVKWSIKESKKYQRQCKKYGITFYDLSVDFETRINEVVEDLVNTE